MATNCLGGTGATLQVVNTDCGCVSISSISQAQNGLTFTITLDNGQSITLTLPIAPPADAIVPEFRASGTLLQYSVDGGTTWTTIYDLADADGVTVLYNNYSGATTQGTTDEVLDTFDIPANTLATDGDYIEVETSFTGTANGGQSVTLVFDGTPIALGVFLGIPMGKIVIKSRFSRTDAGEVTITSVISSYTGVFTLFTQNSPAPIVAAGLNFAAAITVSANGNSTVIGDITNEYLQSTFYKI